MTTSASPPFPQPGEEWIRELSGGKRSAPRLQMPADGLCGVCDKPVHPSSSNRFYCGSACFSAAGDWHRGQPAYESPTGEEHG